MANLQIFNSKPLRFGISLAGVLIIAALLVSMGNSVNAVTVSLAFILVVLSSATFFGRNPALLASFVAMLCFNYFFLPPVHTWQISDPQNLIAWAAFTIAALVAGELSAYARRRAREAERLLAKLEATFETATEAAALRQSEQLKSALLDAVTHDLRTPLTSIKAAVTTLLDSEGGHRTIELTSDGRAEFLDVINSETDRLNGFIEGMVQLARIESGTGASKTITHVEEIVTIALERARGLLREHSVTVSIAADLALIRVDAGAMAEVIYYLIENAAKYSPDGTRINITAEPQGSRVFVTVADEGPGIPESMRGRVFEKFVRLDSERSEGLGLGLAIARGIVESQGGTIEVRPGHNDKGTKMVIALPIGD